MSRPLILAALVLPACVLIAEVAISAPSQPVTLNLQDRVGQIELQPDGDRWQVNVGGKLLTGDQYLAALHRQQAKRDHGGPLYHILNITTPAGLIWIGLGLIGQLLFTGRMVVQWLSSEKASRSVVPPVFWHLSLAGATMLLAYFAWRKDIVGVLGQATGWGIYARNLYLIRRQRDEPPPQPTPTGTLG